MTFTASWLTFIAVFALVGAAGARLLFRRLEASDAGTGSWPEADDSARRAGAAAAVALLIGAAFRLLAQAESFLDPGEFLSLGAVRAVLSTAWGRGFWWQAGAAALAGVLAFGPPAMAIVGALIVAGTLPLTGHAMDAPYGPVLGVALHGAHAFAGALWLGTLAVAIFTWRHSEPPERSGRRHARLARLIEKFSPMALACAALLIASGVGEAIWLVGSFRALRETVYGQRLLLKLTLLLGLIAVGAYNWRVIRPTLGTRRSSHRLVRSAALELAIAVAILAVTATLVSLPTDE